MATQAASCGIASSWAPRRTADGPARQKQQWRQCWAPAASQRQQGLRVSALAGGHVERHAFITC